MICLKGYESKTMNAIEGIANGTRLFNVRLNGFNYIRLDYKRTFERLGNE